MIDYWSRILELERRLLRIQTRKIELDQKKAQLQQKLNIISSGSFARGSDQINTIGTSYPWNFSRLFIKSTWDETAFSGLTGDQQSSVRSAYNGVEFELAASSPWKYGNASQASWSNMPYNGPFWHLWTTIPTYWQDDFNANPYYMGIVYNFSDDTFQFTQEATFELVYPKQAGLSHRAPSVYYAGNYDVFEVYSSAKNARGSGYPFSGGSGSMQFTSTAKQQIWAVGIGLYATTTSATITLRWQ